MRFTDIRDNVLGGLNPRSTSRLLQELCEAGVLEKSNGEGYRLTRKVLHWSRGMVRGDGLNEISQPWLNKISTQFGLTSVIYVPTDGQMVCLARARSSFVTSLIPPGQCRPLNIIATGGVFFLPSELLNDQAQLDKQVKKDHSASPNSEAIPTILHNYREHGILDDEALVYPGTWRLAVPLQQDSSPVAALGIAAHTEQLSRPKLRQELLDEMKNASQDIMRTMELLN